MKTKCFSVRLESLISISDKAFKAIDFNGNTDIIPKSQVFGIDQDISKSDAWYIASWILEKKSIIYSQKKERWFDETGKMQITYHFETHIPKKLNLNDIEHDDSLAR